MSHTNTYSRFSWLQSCYLTCNPLFVRVRIHSESENEMHEAQVGCVRQLTGNTNYR